MLATFQGIYPAFVPFLFGKVGLLRTSKVTGSDRYSQDIPQSGMEVPCELVFQCPAGSIEECRKAHRLICGLKMKDSVLDCTDISVMDTIKSKVINQSDEHEQLKANQFNEHK